MKWTKQQLNLIWSTQKKDKSDQKKTAVPHGSLLKCPQNLLYVPKPAPFCQFLFSTH